MARQKQKHSMEFVRQQGEKMFLAGKSGYEISKKLGVTDQTVSNWKKKFSWAEKYEELHNRHLQILVNEALEKTGEKIDDLGHIQRAAIGPIKDGVLTPQYFGEATRAYMDALKLENELRQASINTSFVQDVAKIILEEVVDIDVLNRIKVKIMSLMQKDAQKVLSITGGQEVIEGDVGKNDADNIDEKESAAR